MADREGKEPVIHYISTHSDLQRKEKCLCLLQSCSAMDLSMEFLLKPVSRRFAKCESELAHKLLAVLQMIPGRKNQHISPSTCSQ